MQDTIVTFYCICDDLLKALEHQDDQQTRYSSAEVMTVPLTACAFFGGNMALARNFLHSHGYTQHTLSASRFSRRLAALPGAAWSTLFALLGQVFKQHNSQGVYVVDSLPVPVCDNIRIKRCQLFQDEAYRGYTASKRRYFYGLKVHLLITGIGEPVEFVLTPGETADPSGLKLLPLDLEPGCLIHADKGYTDYQEEDLLLEAGGIRLQALRKKNSKRPLAACLEFLAQPVRQRIETAFSQITALFPKHIHAVTPHGFVLKLTCFLLAYSIQCL